MVEISGGDKLAAKLRELAARISTKKSVKTGFYGSTTYPDGTTVASVAAFNEFGVPSRGQPPRPFFRNMIAAHSHEWGDKLGKLLQANNMDGEQSLDLIGHVIEGELKDSITSLTDPPLAPSTVARKGSAKPLIDTGLMLRSVSHEVES